MSHEKRCPDHSYDEVTGGRAEGISCRPISTGNIWVIARNRNFQEEANYIETIFSKYVQSAVMSRTRSTSRKVKVYVKYKLKDLNYHFLDIPRWTARGGWYRWVRIWDRLRRTELPLSALLSPTDSTASASVGIACYLKREQLSFSLSNLMRVQFQKRVNVAFFTAVTQNLASCRDKLW